MKTYSLLAAGVLMAVSAAQAEPMPMDRSVQIGGLDTVCTGVGSGKDDPQWLTYPIRIEFANAAAQNLAGAHVVLTQGARTVADFDCPGTWVLLKGKPGTYHVSATIDNSTAKAVTAAFTLGSGAQKRVVLRYPDFQANE